jgi:hypothetical protein
VLTGHGRLDDSGLQRTTLAVHGLRSEVLETEPTLQLCAGIVLLRAGEDAKEALTAFNDFSDGYQTSAARPQPLFCRRGLR